ncbi:hypothetical protein KCP73_15715 [Salmonella enterica subsp. enterica]|nr:hypothetical protein KCP73_15715 [Salmonella enterica subsp. enterica]
MDVANITFITSAPPTGLLKLRIPIASEGTDGRLSNWSRCRSVTRWRCNWRICPRRYEKPRRKPNRHR